MADLEDLRPEVYAALLYKDIKEIAVKQAQAKVDALGEEYDKRAEGAEPRVVAVLQAEYTYRVQQVCDHLNVTIHGLQEYIKDRFCRWTTVAVAPEAAGVAPQ